LCHVKPGDRAAARLGLDQGSARGGRASFHLQGNPVRSAGQEPTGGRVDWHRWLAIVAMAVFASFAGCTTDGRLATAGNASVGSDECGTCHAAEFGAWKDAVHARTVRAAGDGLLPEAVGHWAIDSQGNAGPTTGNMDGKPYGLADVQFVVGSKWKQRYLVRNPASGTHQFLDKQWNRYAGVWEPYGQKGDWESQCATCHAKGIGGAAQAAATSATRAAAAALDERAACETCHGPGARHAASAARTDIVMPGRATQADAGAACIDEPSGDAKPSTAAVELLP
jgi:hypothetical protein